MNDDPSKAQLHALARIQAINFIYSQAKLLMIYSKRVLLHEKRDHMQSYSNRLTT